MRRLAGQTRRRRRLLEKSELAGKGSLRRQNHCIIPMRGRTEAGKVCQQSLKAPKLSLHEHCHCLRQGLASTGKEKGQGHGVHGKWHKLVEQRPFRGAGITSHHNPDLSPIQTQNMTAVCPLAHSPKAEPDNSQVRPPALWLVSLWMNHWAIFLYLSFRCKARRVDHSYLFYSVLS